jgi:uncharacterized protein (TIGR02302 family)
MTAEPQVQKSSRLDRRIAAYGRAAEIVLWTERLLAAFWAVPTLIAGFVVLALLGIPQSLPAWLHLLLLVGLAFALAFIFRAGLRKFEPPALQAARRRVEHDSALVHRPFDALADRPADAETNSVATSLWRLYQERRRAEIGRLRLALPQPGLPELDPWALRLFVVVVLVFAAVMAGPRAGQRLIAALTPDFTPAAGTLPVEAWIKPPAYTGLAPILLKPDNDDQVAVPTGSTLEAHVTGGSRVPHLTLGNERQDFKQIEGGGFTLSRTLTTPGTLSISRSWSTLARWKISIIPDLPPTVEFAEKPTRTLAGALKIDYRATDDYGVASVELDMRAAPGEPKVVAEPIAASLASGRAEKDVRGSSFQDLTSHPWAGMKVIAKLKAIDVVGQSSESQEIALTLPEHIFLNAAAKGIIETRKHVILNDAPYPLLAFEIAKLAAEPALYHNDLGVFLALDVAKEDLRRAKPDNAGQVLTIEDLLWNAAIKIEDGDRPDADKNLRAAEDALEKALKDPNTPASEIARLTQNLKDAMNRDIQAMMDQMRKKQESGQQDQQADPGSKTTNQQDLNNQVDKMNQMAQSGSREAAQDMLDYIKQLLENMKAAQAPGKSDEQAKKSMDALKDMAKKQRDMENGNSPNTAENQEALRKALGEAARQLGESGNQIPQGMGNADKAMRNAEKALQRGSKGGAQADQEAAAGQMDEAAKSLSQQMSQEGEAQSGDGQDGGQDGKDPFGRGTLQGGRIKMPTERQFQRSRSILDELRKRASEHDRPRQELDYLRRLLQEY